MSGETRDRIVATARRLFYTHGFAQTSLGDLAREAGVPKGNFYYHFPSKDDVLQAVLAARHADIERHLSAWQEAHPAPRDRLRRFLRMIAAEQEQLVEHGCPTGTLLTELGKQGHELHVDARAALELYVRFAETCLGEAGPPRATPRTLAERLLARVQGAILLAHAYRDPARLERELREIERWLGDLEPRPPTRAGRGGRRPGGRPTAG